MIAILIQFKIDAYRNTTAKIVLEKEKMVEKQFNEVDKYH